MTPYSLIRIKHWFASDLRMVTFLFQNKRSQQQQQQRDQQKQSRYLDEKKWQGQHDKRFFIFN